MIELRITTRDDLAKLWLPWCVARDRRSETIRIADEPGRRDEAMQLRVGDLADDEVRAALATQVKEPGILSLPYISSFADTFAKLAALGEVIVSGAELFPTPQGAMLHEGCHRSCGLFEAGLAGFELRAVAHLLEDPWRMYDHPTLRRR